MNNGMGKAHPCIFSQSDDPKKGCAALREKYCMTTGKCNFYKSSAEWEISKTVDNELYKINTSVVRKDREHG